jgi:hypothetical protein
MDMIGHAKNADQFLFAPGNDFGDVLMNFYPVFGRDEWLSFFYRPDTVGIHL